MARYRLLEPSVVDGALLDAGAEVEIDYEPGPQMQPLDPEGERRLKAFKLSRASLEPDYPNSGWPLIDKFWFAYLMRRLEERRTPNPEVTGRRK